MSALAAIRRAVVLSLAIAGVPAASDAEEGRAADKTVCLNAADTRDVVKTRKLLEPFTALKYAATQKKAEALSAKLCHTGDEFFYEITLLHHDGRLVRAEVEAEATKPALRATHERETRETIGRDRPPQ